MRSVFWADGGNIPDRRSRRWRPELRGVRPLLLVSAQIPGKKCAPLRRAILERTARYGRKKYELPNELVRRRGVAGRAAVLFFYEISRSCAHHIASFSGKRRAAFCPVAYFYARRRIYGRTSGYGVARRIVARRRGAKVFAAMYHYVRGHLPGNTAQHVLGGLRAYFWRIAEFLRGGWPASFPHVFTRILALAQSRNKAYISQQDGASARRATALQDWRRGNFHAFWPKEDWSPDIPGFSPLGFFVWG